MHIISLFDLFGIVILNNNADILFSRSDSFWLSFIFSVGVAKEYRSRENAYICFDSNSHKSYFRSKDVTEESCYHWATT